MKPRAWVKSVTFNDGTTIQLEKGDVVVIVGSNNSGKSATLRGIRDKLIVPTNTNIVISNIEMEKEGTYNDLIEWLESSTKKTDTLSNEKIFQGIKAAIDGYTAKSIWEGSVLHLHSLAGFFCHLLTADERLRAADPPDNIAFTSEAPTHPIHYLQRDDTLENKLSQQFRSAFGVDLIVHRNAGSKVPIHVGEKPILKVGQDRVSMEYVIDLEKLPPIHTQGDGMRSFAGVLLLTSIGEHSVMLIDEPEAFLHPPQARYLGKMIVLDKQSDRQLFIATHSGDVLRGVLDSNSCTVRVVRIRRSGQINIARELINSEISQVWDDPLLRYSNILDGLFHEKVVVCESDADCRFYAAVMDALFDGDSEERRKPDIMFTHCGGKGRLPLIIRSLRKLEVPIAVVTDFDVLNDEHPLRDIVENAGGNWADIVSDWLEVKKSVDEKKPELNTEDIKKEIAEILESVASSVFPVETKKKIQGILKRSSPWSTAKTIGIRYVPNGQPSRACERLLKALHAWNIFIVPVGELEGFSKTTGNHGPSWVNEVLKKDLLKDPELSEARNFVSQIVG